MHRVPTPDAKSEYRTLATGRSRHHTTRFILQEFPSLQERVCLQQRTPSPCLRTMQLDIPGFPPTSTSPSLDPVSPISKTKKTPIPSGSLVYVSFLRLVSSHFLFSHHGRRDPDPPQIPEIYSRSSGAATLRLLALFTPVIRNHNRYQSPSMDSVCEFVQPTFDV